MLDWAGVRGSRRVSVDKDVVDNDEDFVEEGYGEEKKKNEFYFPATKC